MRIDHDTTAAADAIMIGLTIAVSLLVLWLIW